MGAMCGCFYPVGQQEETAGSRVLNNPGSVAPIVKPSTTNQVLTEEDKEKRRQLQADAAAARAKDFKQGGGGDKLKAKTKALEQAEQKQRELGGPATLKWTV